MKISTLLAVSALMVPALFACKTTEANYRSAYEKAVEARADEDALDSSVYGSTRRQMTTATLSTESGDIDVRRQLVRVTEDGGGIPENLRQYNVVVGQFKQLFNARSLRDRLVAMGYPSAFVVETAEPYYYIVVSSTDDVIEAKNAMDRFVAAKPITMKAPLPFILDATRRHHPRKK